MQFDRASYLNTRRDAWVEINLNNIEHNILEFKKYLKKAQSFLPWSKQTLTGTGR